jgi:hypothetical protein
VLLSPNVFSDENGDYIGFDDQPRKALLLRGRRRPCIVALHFLSPTKAITPFSLIFRSWKRSDTLAGGAIP